MDILLAILVIYGVIVLTLFLAQRRLVFQPSVITNYPMDSNIIGVKTVDIHTADDLTLQSWYHPPEPDYPVIVYFHGNAGNLMDRAARYRMFMEKGFGLFALSYRGYGGNPGAPSELGLYEDARAALHYVREQGIPNEKIILYGESLGTGVAIQMATEFEPGMLVLEAPFTSVADRGQELYPIIPVKLLIKDRFDSLSKIDEIKVPLLLFHGEKDAVIPVAQGRTLFEAANEPKKGVFFKDNGHTDFDIAEIGILVEEQAREHGLIK